MRFFARARRTAPAAAPPSFGAWVVHQVGRGEDPQSLPFNRLEQVCSKAASLVCGAVYAAPETFRSATSLEVDVQREAGLVARRTADGFQASLADRNHAILAWPWDHIATRVAWLGSQGGELSEDHLGREIDRVTLAYALLYREQLTAVLGLWANVAAAVSGSAAKPDLAFMGSEMHRAFIQLAT